MSTPLLTTKLYIPPPRPNLVPRPRLVERLDEGLGLGHRLFLISAPAGFGKTTLATEWLYSGYKHISPLAVAWLSLDEGDSDPVRFLTYLLASLQQIDGGIGRSVRGLLESPQLPPLESLMTLLANDLAPLSAPFVLVLDDYHLVRTSHIHDALAFLLDHQPPPLHLVLVTRERPPLPLARLRAQGQITEIQERDLRFTAEEAAAFLQQTMGLPLSPQAVQTLEARTEGWITGLQLAAVAIQTDLSQARPPPSSWASPGDQDMVRAEAFVAAFTGDDRYVTDYLFAEVLQRQPEAIRAFLCQTAILDRLTAPLCNAVTGREDGQPILEQLDRANLFLTPLDHRREWYRYHRLFAEFLRTTLDRAQQERLHRRAAYWYETQGFLSQAIRHALAYASASEGAPADQAWDDAERLIHLAAEDTIFGGGLLTVSGWLDALPDERVRANGELATFKGWVLALAGEMARAEEYAAAAEAADPGLDKLLALRSFVAVFGHRDYEAAIELSSRALQSLARDEGRWRVIALWALAESQERTSNVSEAIATLREAQRAGRGSSNQVFAATVDLFLATDLNLNGRRREAVAVCEEAIARHTDPAGRVSPVTSPIFARLGTLYYESNQLELAREHLERSLALSEQLALGSWSMFAQGFAAPILHALGETDAALEALQTAYQLTTQTGLADAEWCLACEANIRLQQGDLASALHWAETAGLSPDEAPQYLRLEQHLVYGRLLLAQGRLAEARRWLARLERFVRERGLYRWLITVHILQALTVAKSGDPRAARDLLTQALEIAAPEGYVRAFLDEEEQVVALLPQVRPVAPRFVDQILAYAGVSHRGAESAEQPPAEQPLVEPLSERELEVLGLIAAGLTNREIADRLFIAHGTVKRHINNLYGKLQVHRRTEAVARARELGLL